MSFPYNLVVSPRGTRSSMVAVCNEQHKVICRNNQAVEDILRSNVTSLCHIVHRAMAGRGWIDRAYVGTGEWTLTVHATKSRYSWYTCGQDPYAVFLSGMLGYHGDIRILDDSASVGYPLSITLVHDMEVPMDAKIIFNDPQRDFIEMCARNDR